MPSPAVGGQSGMFTSRASHWAGVYFTGTRYNAMGGVSATAGTSGGIICDIGWIDIAEHDPDPGTTELAFDATPYNQHYPRGERGRFITLSIKRWERALYDALAAQLTDDDHSKSGVLYHRSGTYTFKAKPLRPKALSSPGGEHRWAGGKGLNLLLRLVTTEGSWSAPNP